MSTRQIKGQQSATPAGSATTEASSTGRLADEVANEYRRVVEDGGALRCRVGDLVAGFGYDSLTPEAWVNVELRLLAVGLLPKRTFRGPLRDSSRVTIIATEQDTDQENQGAETEVLEVNVLGVGMAWLGAVAMVVAVFLPRVDTGSTGFFRVSKNTLIQSGEGWLLLLFAVGVAAAAYDAYSSKRKGWALIFFGLCAVGVAVAVGTDEAARTLYPAVNGVADTSSGGTVASPGVGIWLAGVAGALAICGGWLIRRSPVTRLVEHDAELRDAKKCPDCAERVLAEARVCRYCGHRFDE